MKIASFLIVSIALLCSCDKKQNNQTETQTAAVSSTELPKTLDTATVVSASQNNAVASAPQKENVVVTTASPSEKPTLNPAHGQPYHRCDIEVGAPIDSPAKNVAPPIAPQKSPANNSFNTNPISVSPSVPSAQPAPSSGPKPATNPAHGQPHHRCDLAAGAPLN